MPEKRRKPWVAGLLSGILPGLGQMYNGQAKRGLLLYVLFWLIPPASLLIMMGLPLPPLNVAAPIFLFLSVYGYICVDAIRTARRQRSTYQLKVYNKWYLYLLAILIASFVVQPAWLITLRGVLVQPYVIATERMVPTILIGDYFFVDKFTYHFKVPGRGDVIVFEYSDDESRGFINRVIGLPGDVVEIRKKQVYINGEPLEEPYAIYKGPAISTRPQLPEDLYGPVIVPRDKVFVLGDNRNPRQDSRVWSFLDVSLIKGKARTIYWSWDSSAHRVRWERVGQAVQ